jgi:hypothetical protein
MSVDTLPVHDRDMVRLPLLLLVASTMTLVVAFGAFLFGAFFLAIAAGAIEFYGNTGYLSPVGLIGAASITYGALALIAAGGLAAQRAWAWVLAAMVHVVALTGILAALATSGFGVHIAAGLLLVLGGLAGLVPASTREALWR